MRFGWPRAAGLAAGLAGVLAAAPAGAAPCRLALVLALDVSSSVDAPEDRLQRDGLAAALIAPEVEAAFLAGAPVALAAFEWSGRHEQDLLLDWRLIGSAADLVAAAQAVHESRRGHDDLPTAMGYALGHASLLLREAPPCERQVIDVSGDGVNNEGFGPSQAYGAFPFAGVQVNGLAIVAPGEEGRRTLDFYLGQVRHGPGAFVEIADGFAGFERAMRRKLVRELGGMALSEAVPPLVAPPGRRAGRAR